MTRAQIRLALEEAVRGACRGPFRTVGDRIDVQVVRRGRRRTLRLHGVDEAATAIWKEIEAGADSVHAVACCYDLKAARETGAGEAGAWDWVRPAVRSTSPR